MKRMLLLLVVGVCSIGIYLNPMIVFGHQKPQNDKAIKPAEHAPSSVEEMLFHERAELKQEVIDKVLSIINCASNYHLEYNPILTVIDYSMPASEKRLWIFDLNEKKLLFHTYVAHGIKSGERLSTSFSNKYDSKSSSIGVYRTEKAYYGREGLSLILEGLEAGFNDNAYNRSIVMHGGWYLDEGFIKKYGRSGRSWGCPAVPLELAQPIINTIKDRSLFVVYYPSENWFLKSKYLQCEKPSYIPRIDVAFNQVDVAHIQPESRDEVFFVDKKIKEGDSSPIVVMPADRYFKIFQTDPPLTRMLRRQINHMEYIALNHAEFQQLKERVDQAVLDAISFVIPVIKMHRGYYATEMKLVTLGKITKINNVDQGYMIHFESNPSVRLNSEHHFIRWLGL